MEKDTIKGIIKALKGLISDLKNGYCNELNSDQLKRLESGFASILSVEQEIKKQRYDRLHSNRSYGSNYYFGNIIHAIFSFKKERKQGKIRK